MFYERRIGSLAAVVKEAKTMDADAGIRLSGKYQGRICYAFLSRFGPKYTVMVYERKPGREGGVGKRLASLELDSLEELKDFLRRIASGSVDAFAY